MEKINWMKYQKTRVLITTPPFLAGWTSQPSLSVPPPTCHVSSFQKHFGALMKRKKGRNCFQYENLVFKVFQTHWPELIDIPHCIYSGFIHLFYLVPQGLIWVVIGISIGKGDFQQLKLKKQQSPEAKAAPFHPFQTSSPPLGLPRLWSIPFEDTR